VNKELAAGMLEFSKGPIPTTLTVRAFELTTSDEAKPTKDAAAAAKDLKKVALNLFKNILG
jgi:hypothetical protein